MYEKLQKLLAEREKTFADLSRATGIVESTFANCKRRGTNLSIKNAVKVAKFLGVSVDELIGEKE